MTSARKHVFLDPDGTWPPGWLMLVVAGNTGVVYEQQCGGLACYVRQLEGYLVPLGGLKFDPEQGQLAPVDLTAVFHAKSSCVGYETLSPDRVRQLRDCIAMIPYWTSSADGDTETRVPLALDESRVDEAVEAWVPVSTPDGRGVLMWENCD